MTPIKKNSVKPASILWLSDTQPLDVFLHKMSLTSVAEACAKNGNDVTLIASLSKGSFRTNTPNLRLKLFPLRFVRIISPILYSIVLSFLFPLLMVFSKFQYVVIEYDLSSIACIFGLLLAKIKKIKIILDVRSIPVETKGSIGFIHNFKFSLSILVAKKMFDGITILTSQMKEELCAKFTINHSKVGVWTSGVSVALFNPDKFVNEAAELKQTLGLTGKFVVFYHGVLTATRGLQETVDAMVLLRTKNPDIVFFMLGTGPARSFLETLIKEKNLVNNVILHDSVNQSTVPCFISMSDVGIVPLHNNPFWRYQSPLKLLEYLSMNKVVILSDIPAHRFVVGEKKCGIYLDSVKPSDIAKAVDFAYNNQDSLFEWGKTGRRIVNENYTWRKVSRDLENFLFML